VAFRVGFLSSTSVTGRRRHGCRNADGPIQKEAVMRYAILLVALLVLTTSLAAYCETGDQGNTAGTQQKSPATTIKQPTPPTTPGATQQKQVAPTMQQPSKSPQAAIEDTWVYFVDEPESHFAKAREHFVNKDMRIAADEIRIGAAFFELESSRAQGKAKIGLEVSYRDLLKLADNVQAGSVKTEKELDQGFARADHALSQHHYAKASEYWASQEKEKAGHELEAAATHVEYATRWSGTALSEASTAALKSAREVADKMVSGGQHTETDVRKAMDDTGKEIESLGGRIGTAVDRPQAAKPKTAKQTETGK
jgi:hypothetical protein